MKEYTYCTDSTCPEKDDCVRFTLEPRNKQRVFYKSPRNRKKGNCEFFIKRQLNPLEKENVET